MSNLLTRTAEPRALDGLEVRGPDCVAEDFGGEIVVLNTASGMYYSLTDLASAVWRDLVCGHSVDALVDAIGSIDEQTAQRTTDFIHRLETEGLMRRAHTQASNGAPPESIALVRVGETKLTIQSFDDMQDLITADPIHDVDNEVGWPMLQRGEDA